MDIIKKGKCLGAFSLIMINIIAVDSLRSLPISAEYGFSLVFYYLIGAVLFFIPTALVAAELATHFPKTGGIYIWVSEAFGKRAGFITVWLQWIYDLVWYPTIMVFIATTLAYVIDPSLAANKTYLISTVMVFFWGATFINCFGMRMASWFSSFCAIVGTLVPMILIILLGTVWFYSGKPEHLVIDAAHFWPKIDSWSDMAFVSAILFGLIGMEMSAVHAGDVVNPKRAYPIAIAVSSVMILATLVLGSLAIAIVVPHDKLSMVSGLLDAFDTFFKAYHMEWMNPIIDIAIIIGAIGGVAAWVIGPLRALQVAMVDCDMTPGLRTLNRFGAPGRLLILQAVLFSLLCSIFIIIPSINTSYWVLSALTAQIALIVYCFFFASGIRLKQQISQDKEAFSIPGGRVGMWLIAGMGFIVCCFGIFVGFFPPSVLHIKNIASYELMLIAGLVFLCLPAVWIVCRRA